MKYAIYIRVSTQKQGHSGLGLEAQRTICKGYIDSVNGELTQIFKDIESGTHRDRPGLKEALDYCKKNNCTLVIAKLDRLARNIEFTFKVVNSGVQIHFCDMPQVNTLILGIFATVAQYERELTSKRTKDALAAKKKQGVKLGNPNWTLESVSKASKVHAQRSRNEALNNPSNKIAWEILKDINTADTAAVDKAVTLLNNAGITTPTGLAYTRMRLRARVQAMKKSRGGG